MARRYNGFQRGYASTGVNAAVQALREISVDVEQAAKEALKKGVNEIVVDAKSRCPVYAGAERSDVQPGELRDSIKAVSKHSGAVYSIEANAKSLTSGQPYGLYVEFSPKINKPFLYPAFDAHANEVRANIVDAVKRAVRRHRGQ